MNYTYIVIFVVFIGLFLATAIITLLGLVEKVKIKDGYLKALFTSLLLELIAVVIVLGGRVLNPPEPVVNRVTTGDNVWAVYGTLHCPTNIVTEDSIVQPLPASVDVKPNGNFKLFVLAEKVGGRLEFPSLAMSHPADSNLFAHVTLTENWGAMTQVNPHTINRDGTNRVLTISTPVKLTHTAPYNY